MCFTDIHTHILAGVDDGARDQAQMYDLLDALYREGARRICCTPHYHPGYYGFNDKRSADVFRQLEEYAESRYPDLKLCLGNELRYGRGCLEWVETGRCRTLNGTRYVLIDFHTDEKYEEIEFAAESVLRTGFIPVLAHIERYFCIRRKSRRIKYLRDRGAVIQVNASSILKMHRYPVVRNILRQKMADLVASDTHNLETRPPMLTAAYHEISQKYGKEYAEELFVRNPNAILDR